MIALAISTGIPPDVWVCEGRKAVVTAWHLLQEQDKQQRRGSKGGSGQQLSG